MEIDFEDAAASAAATLKAARMDGEERPEPRLVCKRLGVRLELVAPHVLRGGHSARYSVVGDRIIRRRGLRPSWDAFLLGHELGHRYRRLAGRPHDDQEEAWCNAFAGALLVPSETLFYRWHRGHDLGDLIEAYPNVAPTCLALRVGEARLADTIVVQGRQPRYVRAGVAPSPEMIDVAAEAARHGRATRAGVAKAWRMIDGPTRAAVVADVG